MQVTLSHFSTVPCRLLAMKIFVIGSGTKTHSIGMRHKHLTTCTEGEFKVTKEGYLLFNKSHTKLIYHHITLHHITSHHNCITLHHIASHHITLHCITSHCITLHHITLHHITSHCITSHHNRSACFLHSNKPPPMYKKEELVSCPAHMCLPGEKWPGEQHSKFLGFFPKSSKDQ